MIRFDRHQRTCTCLAAMLALAAIAANAAPARAAIDNAGFSLKISEKEKALSDPTNMDLMKFMMWDLSADRVMARNMPYLELKNDATSSAPITEFRMTIGDERFHFNCQMLGSCAMLANSTPNVALSSSVANSGNELVLTLGNGGLAPGNVVRFRIALSPDASNMFHMPDYRTVLFDMNSINVYDGMLHTPSNVDEMADNAKASAKFQSGSMSATVGPVAFDDFAVLSVAGQYFNNNYRRYGVMEPVESFALVGSGSTIPEPQSALLVGMALLGMSLWRSRSRKRLSA